MVTRDCDRETGQNAHALEFSEWNMGFFANV